MHGGQHLWALGSHGASGTDWVRCERIDAPPELASLSATNALKVCFRSKLHAQMISYISVYDPHAIRAQESRYMRDKHLLQFATGSIRQHHGLQKFFLIPYCRLYIAQVKVVVGVQRRLKFATKHVSCIEWVEEPKPDLLFLLHCAASMVWLVLEMLCKVLPTWQVLP